MASTSLHITLSLLLLISPTSFATIHDLTIHQHEFSHNPKSQAERLIRALNLFRGHDVKINTGDNSSLTASSGIVEKGVVFPSLVGSDTSVQDLGHHAGYYRLPRSKDARMFYFFFESRNKKTDDPVVIWLTGGPGCGGEIALFYENGPFHITDNLSLAWNEYGWDKVSNIIYVDQPTGTGFSYSSKEDDLRHDERGVSQDLYDFLQAFFKEHPQFARNDFYITGESYAGHYIPAFAARIQQGNRNKEGLHINLKGLAIGNGLTNPEIQYSAYPDYALNANLISKSDYNRLGKSVSKCAQAAKLCGAGKDDGTNCLAAYYACNAIFNKIMDITGNKNFYDIRKECQGQLCYDFSNVENFLHQKSVKNALGVGNIDFVSCSDKVYEAMVVDLMKNLAVDIPSLLEDGIKLLVYAGEYDLICNWLGNSRWVHAMAWSGRRQFVTAPTTPFTVDGKEAGKQKSHGPLTFLKVHDAGHMVPMDQPKASLEMLRRWMQGKTPLAEIKDQLSPM
ncbi:serine protease [Lithospermum erythrorhizon]|uniref:Carboxypeptidase n=1 Tax=Lithospermum erythrorhizon TaxID=34254 RepID=A0AAV3NK54_LITER